MARSRRWRMPWQRWRDTREMCGRQSSPSPVRTRSGWVIPTLKTGRSSSTHLSPTSARAIRSIRTAFVGTRLCTKRRSTSMFAWCSSQPIQRRAISPGRVSAASSPRWSARSTGTTACTSMSRRTNSAACSGRKRKHGWQRLPGRCRLVLCKAISWSFWWRISPSGSGRSAARKSTVICRPVSSASWMRSWMNWQRTNGCRPPMLYGRISESSFALTMIRHRQCECRCRSKRSSRLCATWSSGKHSGFRRCASPSRMMPCRMSRSRKNRPCLQIQMWSG